ncbi:MAG: hypothetical protein M3O34_10315 [Chloroflexota bacterium]|nr:hypothetical protein [Chloroflexota bacterium]
MSKSDLKSMPGKVAKLLGARRKELAAIDADPKYSDTFKVSQREMAEGDYRHRLAMLTQAHEHAVDALKKDVARAFEPKGDVNAQMLAEMKGERAWARAARQLDPGADPLEVIGRLAEAGDRTALTIAREELGAYMASKNAPQQAVDGALEYLEQAIEPLATPAELKARELEREAGDLAYFAKAALEFADFELSGQGTVDTVPSAEGGLKVEG